MHGALVDEVAFFVGTMGLEDGDVGPDRAFDEILDAVEAEFGFAFFDDGADAGRVSTPPSPAPPQRIRSA